MNIGLNDIHQNDIGFQKVNGCIVARKFSNLCRYIDYKIPFLNFYFIDWITKECARKRQIGFRFKGNFQSRDQIALHSEINLLKTLIS